MFNAEEFRKELNKIIEVWETGIDGEETGVRDEDIKEFEKIFVEFLKSDECEEFKLYKYCPAEFYTFRNIELGRIHLSPNGNLNDLYEGMPKGDIEGFVGTETFNNFLLSSSFSESNNNPLMWAHYADSYRGICIEYDLKKLSTELLLEHGIYPIIYSEKRLITRDLPTLKKDLESLDEAMKGDCSYEGTYEVDKLLPLMLVKGKDWEYEKEWRVICSKKQMYDDYYQKADSLNIDFDCITAIYLGYRINQDIKQFIKEILERKNNSKGYEIELKEMHLLPDDSYTIDFK